MRTWRSSRKAARLGLFASVITFAGEQTPMTTEEIVTRMVAADDARTLTLRSYTSVRKYSLDNKRFAVHAAMTVRVAYEYPGPKHFTIVDESGPAAVRTRVFRRMLDTEMKASVGRARDDARFSPRNYTFTLTGERELQGRACFVLKVEPKTNNPVLFRGEVYVDTEDYAIAYVDGAPAQNPSFWLTNMSVRHRYGKFGAFWLPVANDSASDVRIFGHTQVRIEYSDYEVNKLDGTGAVSPRVP